MFDNKRGFNLLMMLVSYLCQINASHIIINQLLDRKPHCDVEIIIRNYFKTLDIEGLMSGRVSIITTTLSQEVIFIFFCTGNLLKNIKYE